MRELKFRAWDKRREWMLYDGDSCGYVEFDKHDVDVVNLLLSGRDEDLTFLQYTGLKDENGREIYEGDIVYQLSEMTYESIRGVVKFVDGSYVIENGDGTEGVYLFGEVLYNEVIGNIHENPELLGDS